MWLFFAGIALIAAILAIFYLKDKTEKVWLARLAYSGLVARLAVAGAVLTVLGVLLMLSEIFS